jgi:hypothetical protein
MSATILLYQPGNGNPGNGNPASGNPGNGNAGNGNPGNGGFIPSTQNYYRRFFLLFIIT